MPTISSVSKIQVVFILGATGAGKSKLAISLANSFAGEIINSDKIQVYDAIPVIANRVSDAEQAAVRHHLLAFVPSNADYDVTDFIRDCMDSICSIASRNHLPIIAGGSNNYIKALLDDPKFRSGHEASFIRLNANTDILNRFVSARVDSMMQRGLVEEARSLFDPENSDYTRGVRAAIGVPELDGYFRAVLKGLTGEEELEIMLEEAVNNIKANTCQPILDQVEKIKQMIKLGEWHIHLVDVSGFLATKLAGTLNDVEEDDLWEQEIGMPCREIVREFLDAKNKTRF